MQSSTQTYATVEADVIGTKTTISTPRISDGKLTAVVSKWIGKHGKQWPSDLTVAAFTTNIQLVFLPYWVVTGEGSANWSASIGQEYQEAQRCNQCQGRGRLRASEDHFLSASDEMVNCSNCGGSGRELVTKTRYISQSGFVNGLVEGRVIENLSPGTIKLKLKKFDFTVPEEPLDEVNKAKYLVLRPEQMSQEAGLTTAKDSLREALRSNAYDIASDMGPTRNLQLANINVENLDAHIWLYPLFLGFCSYADESLEIQIDGTTGEVYAQLPKSVRVKRMNNRLIFAAVAMTIGCVVLALIYHFGLENDILKFLYNY